jgi:hypothetical protein
MVTKSELLRALPAFKDNYVLRVKDQDTKDIIQWLLNVTPKYAKDYDRIYEYFDTGNLYDTCKGIWNFLKYNFTYNAESINDQSVRSPAAIIELDNIDCKHYSLFIGGVLDAIKRNTGDNFSWCYRLASYDGDVTPGHVFVVAKDKGEVIWIDPVLANFDERKQPSYYFDKKPGAKLAGVLAGGSIGNIVTEYPALTFLAMRAIYKMV